MKRAFVIYNPVAGSGRADALSVQGARALEQRGWSVDRVATRGPGDATPLAARAAADHADLVAVAGGDGSVREAIAGLTAAGRTTAVAVLPAGNANVVARELGIPLAAEGALDVLTHGTTTAVDLGFVDDDLFLAMVGVGWDARTIRNLDRLRSTAFGRAWYRLWADSAYFAAGLAALEIRRPSQLDVRVDGAGLPRRYCAALVSNYRCYGKGWAMAPDARFDSGLLHYQMRKRFGFPFVALQLIAAMRRRPVPAFVSDLGTGRRVTIRADRPFPVHADGDFRGYYRELELRIEPAAASILAPARAYETEPRREVSRL